MGTRCTSNRTGWPRAPNPSTASGPAAPDLQRAHAVAPWVPVYDDHEVESAWAGDVPEQPDPPLLPRRAVAFKAYSESVAVELVATSITSERDGLDVCPNTQILLDENPHVKFFNGRRGYVNTRISAERVEVDFRSLKYVSTAGAPAYTSGSFVIEAGDPHLKGA